MKRTLIVAWALVVAAVLWTAFTRASFSLRGDATGYMEDAAKIQHGYLQQNLEALRDRNSGEEAEFVQLTTEGAFAVALWLARAVHHKLPFLVNVAVASALIFMVMLLARMNEQDKTRGRFAALFVLILALAHPDMAKNVWYCVWPLRSPLAFFFGFSAVTLSIFSARNGTARYGMVFGAGLLLGLAVFSRAPSGLFLFPAATYLLLALGVRPFKRTVLVFLCLGAGLIVGAIPMFAQNVLEGRAFYEATQVSDLAFQKINHAGSGQRRGINLANFPVVFPEAIRFLLGIFPWWTWILIVAAYGYGLKTRLRFTLTMLAGIAVFTLFYGCYHQVIRRYYFPAIMFLVAGAASFPAALLAQLNTKKPQPWLFPALACVAAAVCLFHAQSTQARSNIWQDAERFDQWIDEHFEPTDVFILNRQAVEAWTHHFSAVRRRCFKWAWNLDVIPHRTWTERSMRVKEELEEHRAEGARIFYFDLCEQDGAPRLSWWRDDLKHHYEFKPGPPDLVLPGWESRLKIYRLARPSTTTRQLGFSLEHADTPRLLVLAREVNGGEPSDGLRSGLNLLPLPARAKEGVTIQSETPLPSVVQAEPLGYNPVGLPLNDAEFSYEHAPTLRRLFSGVGVAWEGYISWHRDWCGDPWRNYKNRPLFLVQPGCAVRLPQTPDPLVVRLVYEMTGPSAEACEALRSSLSYRINDQALPHSTFNYYQVDQRSGLRFERFVEKIRFPAGTLTSPAKGLQVMAMETEDVSLRFGRIEFLSHPDASGKRAPGSAVLGMQALEAPHPWFDDFKAEPSDDPTFRILDSTVDIAIPSPATSPAKLLFFDVFAPEAGAFSLLCLANGQPIGRIDVPSSKTSQRVFLPVTTPSRAVVLTLTPLFDTPPRRHPIAYAAGGAILSRGDRPPDRSMRPGAPLDFLTRGVFPSEPQPDGGFARWTRARAQLTFPLPCEPQSYALTLTVRGPSTPEQTSKDLKVSVNGQSVRSVSVRPWEEGFQRYEIPVDPALLVYGMNDLVLESPAWTPAELFEGNRDRRKLGVYLKSIEWDLIKQP